MLSKFKDDKRIRHIILLTFTYLAAQWFLLVVSGRWWDDWVYANKNWDYLFEVYRQSSLPLHAIINAGLWIFPDGFYTIITFFLFFAGSIVLYNLLGRIECFTEDAQLWITLLYIVIPINDARITWICYGYSLGLFLFWLSFYFAVIWKQAQGKKRVIFRVLSVFLLLVSFDTESIMMLTVLILLYFYYEDLRVDFYCKEVLVNLKKLAKSVIIHIDYLMAPILWNILDKTLFPGYGPLYDGHSDIAWDSLPSIIMNSPRNAWDTLKNIFDSYVNLLKNSRIVLYFMVVIIVICAIKTVIDYHKTKGKDESHRFFMKDAIMLILGLGIFFLGFFPYAVKRNSAIWNIYTSGRDSLLLGAGTAILLYYGLSVFFRHRVAKIIMISLVCLGIIHFNYIYLDWQESYYQQVQLQHEIAQNDDIKNNNTFLTMHRGALISSAFYQTNGNSWAATGEETRFYMSGTADLPKLISMTKDSMYLQAWGMKEYECGEKVIDGILFVDYTDIGRKTVLKQKLNEVFDKPSFNKWIDDIKNIKYVALPRKESDNILKLYNSGELTDQMIYDMYY